MNYSFTEWVQSKENPIEEAVQLPRNMRQDPFLSMQQHAGDFVYFGVHDLARFYRENGYLPNLQMQKIVNKVGQIVDADPVEQTVTIATSRDPYHFGYKRMEDTATRQKRKQKGETTAKVTVPVAHLQNINHMLAGAPVTQTLWLVVDGNTPYQQNIMREIRKKEHARTQPMQPNQTPMSPANPASPQRIGRIRDFLRTNGQPGESEPASLNFQQLSGEKPQPPLQQFMLRNRNISRNPLFQ